MQTPQIVPVAHDRSLDDYAAVAQLASAVQELRVEAARLVPMLEGRTVWVVNSTAQGGGVAEMLPAQVCLLRELGLAVEWVVIGTAEEAFFHLTKHIHNLIHGEGDPQLGPPERELYERVNRENADWLRARVRPGDLLVVHDPQPLALGAMLRQELELPAIWRCHIGLDERTPATEAAWEFLEPYASAYDRAVFTAPEYIPGFLAGRATVVHPAIDPLSHKNRDLSIHRLVGTLCNAGLVPAQGPPLRPPFPALARRLQPDDGWGAATEPEEIGLLYRPIITQISRWDRLKGFEPLLRGFVRLKQGVEEPEGADELYRRTLAAVRLVLAGPDPESIQDDPEATEVLEELRAAFVALPAELQSEVAMISLPMESAVHNALMVNALQRCSTIVVQNSLREGFGLTATEAMWKDVPVAGTRAVGLRQQIRDGIDGRLISDAEDPDAIAATLAGMLADPRARERWGLNAQRRVHEEFLIFTQLRRWLELLAEAAGP